MKRAVCSLVIIIALLAGVSGAMERRVLRLGMLSKLNSTEEQFSGTWREIFAPNNESLDVRVKFYDTLTLMQMALDANDIREIVLPDFTAEYLMKHNDGYEPVLVLNSKGMGLAFGFREDNGALRDKFNEAIALLRSNWTLAALEGKYIASSAGEPEPVEFMRFSGVDTIRVAVTGDLPPIDFIAADGRPAGFNTAVLAEIGNILHVNIELVEIDSGARTAALASGRADAVFWYEVDTSGGGRSSDASDGVILSTPYYEWQKFIHIKKAENRESSGTWWDFKNNIFNLYWRQQ